MKTFRVLTIAVCFNTVLMLGQVYAQKVGIAADKQKQANLEKLHARQEELKKKYNSLTPEQAEEARKQANEYKRSGGKLPASSKPAQAGQPVKKQSGPAVISKNPVQVKKGTAPKPSPSPKPVFMDEKGKPKEAAKTAAQPSKNAIKAVKKVEGKQLQPAGNTPAEKKNPTVKVK